MYWSLTQAQHIVGRKHRKFALARDHWKDLDRLLSLLGRPLKKEEPEDAEDEEGEEDEDEEADF